MNCNQNFNFQRVKIQFKVDPFQPDVAFLIETSSLICSANQMTGFYKKCNTRLKWVKHKDIFIKMFPFYYNLVKTWKKNLMYSRSIKQELWPETGLMAAKNIFKISKYRHQNNLWNPFEVYKACQTTRRKACQTSIRKL